MNETGHFSSELRPQVKKQLRTGDDKSMYLIEPNSNIQRFLINRHKLDPLFDSEQNPHMQKPLYSMSKRSTSMSVPKERRKPAVFTSNTESKRYKSINKKEFVNFSEYDIQTPTTIDNDR